MFLAKDNITLPPPLLTHHNMMKRPRNSFFIPFVDSSCVTLNGFSETVTYWNAVCNS